MSSMFNLAHRIGTTVDLWKLVLRHVASPKRERISTRLEMFACMGLTKMVVSSAYIDTWRSFTHPCNLERSPRSVASFKIFYSGSMVITNSRGTVGPLV